MSRRRSGSHQKEPGETIYEWVCLLLLSVSPFAGMIFWGANQIWTIVPFMICTFLGWIMVLLRPCRFSDARQIHWPPGMSFLLLFLLYGAVHLWLSPVSYEARLEWVRVASYLAAYWAWTELMRRVKRWKIILGTLLGLTSLLAWYAIIQYAQGWTWALWVDRFPFYGHRAAATYICPNHFAQVMSLSATLSLALFLRSGGGWVLRLLAGYTFLISLPAIFLSLSRSGMIGLIAGCGVVVLAELWQRRRAWFWISLVSLPLLVGGLGLVLYHGVPSFQERVDGALPGQLDGSAAGRLQAWGDAGQMIQDRLWMGQGAGSFRWVYPVYQTHPMQLWLRFAHNEYIHLASDYGLLGVFILLAAMGAIGWSVLKGFSWGATGKSRLLSLAMLGVLAGVLFHNLFDFTFHIYANVHVLMMVAGVWAASRFSDDDREAVPWKQPYPVLCALGVMMGCVWIALSVQFLFGAWLMKQGDEMKKTFHFEPALAFYSRAVRWDSTDWTAFQARGDVYRMRSFWELDSKEADALANKARKEYQMSLQKNPLDMDAEYGLGDLLTRRGRYEEARVHLQKAVDTNPMQAAYHQRLGLLLQKMDRPEEARAALQKAKELKPDDRRTHAALKMLR